MSTGLERTAFETSRAAEYFDARQLSTLTGALVGSQGRARAAGVREAGRRLDDARQSKLEKGART